MNATVGRIAIATLLLSGCTVWRGGFARPADYATLEADAPFLKVHMHDGGVYVLHSWTADAESVTGSGLHYDRYRVELGRGRFAVDVDGIALLETNRPETVTSPGLAIMGVVTGASLLVTVACLAEPKACFGSCPTFFVDTPDGEQLVAEGFSASVAQVLEARDVDSLHGVRHEGGTFHLRMTNEALETHLVRSLELLSVPVAAGEQAWRQPRGFVVTGPVLPPSRCVSTGDTGDGDRSVDCGPAVSASDAVEHRRDTHPRDLGHGEVIDIELPVVDGEAVVVVAARNSLVTTYVFYQTLAWMGPHAGEWLRRLETSDNGRFSPMGRELADIRISVRTDAGWRPLGRFDEVGPIATDTAAFDLPDDRPPGPVALRLELAQGAWRIDQVGVARVVSRPEPSVIPVASAIGPDSAALAKLTDPDRHLMTSPGDVYELQFELPPAEQALFLASTGWYVEWIRRDWLDEQDPSKVVRLLVDPRGGLRRMAPGFKTIEADIDTIFWESRIGRSP